MVEASSRLGPAPQPWTFSSGGQHRSASVLLPEARNDHPVPAIIMLHGTGATSAWAMYETGWAKLANSGGFAVVCPEALPAHRAHPRHIIANPQVWNDGSRPPPENQFVPDDVAFLKLLFAELPKIAPIDPRRIYLTGFSNGAGMAYRMALEASAAIAAIAPIAGYPTITPAASVRAVPTLCMLGTADPIVPLQGGFVNTLWEQQLRRRPFREALDQWRDLLGCSRVPCWVQNVDGVVMEHYGHGRDGSALEVWYIDGLGHHWPGAKVALNPRIAGPPSDRVLAAEAIWQFFKQYSLP